MLRLREELLQSEEDIEIGVRAYSVSETKLLLDVTIRQISRKKSAGK
jgi:hypothetical protein